jgi:hypothetical protein
MNTGWSQMWGRLSSAPTVGNKILYPDKNTTVSTVALERRRFREEEEVVVVEKPPKVFEPAIEISKEAEEQKKHVPAKRARRRKVVK